jgi:threonine synthase
MVNTFHSTRGHADSLTSKQAIRLGLADDGGLFVTDGLGERGIDLSRLAGRPYQDIAQDVLSALLPDFTHEELRDCIAAAYADQWASPTITPLRALGGDFVLELFHGPTCAFKDVALQILPRFMARTSPRNVGESPEGRLGGQAGADAPERVMILTATSGDTGKAALAGFADAPGTGITVFYPQGKVSEVQELQMTTQTGDNVNVCAVRGNFDDAQSAVKRIFGDAALARELRDRSNTVLSSANSINVGRLVPQVVYYFSAYAQLLERGTIRIGDEVEFCVPTGNFGDVLAGYYAKMLGLPVRRLTVASDRNNVLSDFLTTGTYNRRRPFFETISPSMDILVSSNLERMLYYMSGGDADLVHGLMSDLSREGFYRVPDALLAKIQALFGCGWADESQVRDAIRDCWDSHRYVIDPHTACGYAVMGRTDRDPRIPRILLSTASPFKFPRVVNESLGFECAGTDFDCMDSLARAASLEAPQSLRSLDEAPVRFHDVVDINGMRDVVEKGALSL